MSVNTLSWEIIIKKNNFKKQENTNLSVISILENNKIDNIIKYTSSLELIEWSTYNKECIEYFFEKYPNFSEDKFKKIFFYWEYNRNILRQNKNIIDLFDFENIKPWTDLIEIFINKNWLKENEFNEKLSLLKIDSISFPWLAIWDIAQAKFNEKLKILFKNIKIIFWDEKEIKKYNWKYKINVESMWFWWIWDENPNSCILKLLNSKPDKNKIDELNNIFKDCEKDIFIWWSSDWIPFPTNKLWLQNILLSRNTNNNENIKLQNNKLENSLWYLNSAYYSKKVKWAFVWKDHNFMEAIHAWIPTISNFPKNRYNHNWLASYLWEKFWLLLIINQENNFSENQENIENHLSIKTDDLKTKASNLYEYLNNEIKEFIYWYLYKMIIK